MIRESESETLLGQLERKEREILVKSLLHFVLEEDSREGNGSPLQSSCLENPMDGGAWWAAVHGVS